MLKLMPKDYMKYVGLIAILIVGVILFGCLGQPSNSAADVAINTTGTQAERQSNITVAPSSSQLELDIRIPDTIKMGEQFNGSYYVNYNGTPFTGRILYCVTREGFGEIICGTNSGYMNDVDFDNPEKTRYLGLALQAFKLSENGYACCVDYFYEEGNYTYALSIYDCAIVEKELNKSNCDIRLKDIEDGRILGLKPFKSVNKTITVVGGQSRSECKTSADCKELCEGCATGKQICGQPHEICIDCIHFGCKDGYVCEQNKCVIEK